MNIGLKTLKSSRFDVSHALAKLVFAVVMVCGVSAAHADGDEFFASNLRSVGRSGSGDGARIGFMGTVKDDQGRYLSEAEVTIHVTVPTGDGVEDVTYKSFTDVIGRYRTLDAADVISILKGIDVELKPADVRLDGVSKDGYVQLRRFDRSRTGQTVREIDFVMKKAPD